MNKHKAVIICILMVYVLIVLGETLLFRKPTGEVNLRLELFWSYKVIDVELWQMVGNVLMFIPLAFLMFMLDRRVWLVLLIGFLFSCLIEILQLIFKLGLCELDDIFHNTVGTLIGTLIGKLVIMKYEQQKNLNTKLEK